VAVGDAWENRAAENLFQSHTDRPVAIALHPDDRTLAILQHSDRSFASGTKTRRPVTATKEETMRIATAILVLFGVAACLCAYADSWAAPTTKTYSSEGNLFRLTVMRAALGVKDAKCRSKLEKQIKKGQYDLVWEADLANRVAPVSGLVTKDGQHVVTFDNWHSRGHGDNVVVIYGPNGKQIKKLGISDFVDAALVRRLPLSVGSRWWGQGHLLDEKAGVVILKVGNEGPGFDGKPVEECEVRVRLKDGQLMGNKAGEKPAAKKK
jgi:hypothetical protein